MACHSRSLSSGAPAVSWGCLEGQGHTSPPPHSCPLLYAALMSSGPLLSLSWPGPIELQPCQPPPGCRKYTHTSFQVPVGAELELAAGVPMFQAQCLPRSQHCRCLQLCSAFLLKKPCPPGMRLPCMACIPWTRLLSHIPRLPLVGLPPLQNGTEK